MRSYQAKLHKKKIKSKSLRRKVGGKGTEGTIKIERTEETEETEENKIKKVRKGSKGIKRGTTTPLLPSKTLSNPLN